MHQLCIPTTASHRDDVTSNKCIIASAASWREVVVGWLEGGKEGGGGGQ